MSTVTIEAKADPEVGHVTMDQVSDLIGRAQMMGAPPDATIGFDAVLEFASPIRARRVVMVWEA